MICPSAQREPAAMAQAERVEHGGAVERCRDRCPPVDGDRIVVAVLDVAAADVPAVATVRRVLVDAAEEVAGARRAQVLERLLDGDLDVLGGELVGRILRVDGREHGDHRVAAGARMREAGALEIELWEQGRVDT